METQHHRKASQSGHSGTHICHKCGWLYPNPHPSARHRRAHRKVCGAPEEYKLDNTQDEKTHLDVDVEQCASNNDEHKTPSEKVVERNTSMRSNSGVYSDAVTDFVDGSGLEDASDGVVCRQKSLQKIIEVDSDSSKLATENAITGTIENECAVEHTVEDSRTPSQLNLSLDTGEGEETSSKELSELITPEVAENISDGVLPLRDVSEDLLDSVSGDRIVRPTDMQTVAFEGKVDVEYVRDVDFHVTDSAEVFDSVDGNIEEPISKVNSNEDVCVVSVPDDVPMQEHSEITVENLDDRGGKFNLPMPPNATLAFGRVTTSTNVVLEESCYDTSELANTGKSGGISSQGDILELDDAHSEEDMLKQNVGQNQYLVTQNVVGNTNQLSDPKASDKHIEIDTLKKERSLGDVSLQVDETLVESVPDKEVINARDSDHMGDDEKLKLEGAALKVTERIQGEDESKAGLTQTETYYDSSLPENVELSETENHESRDILDSSQADSLDGNWESVPAVSQTKATRHDMANNNQQADNRTEEIIIAKVTNWGSGKQRTPLKLLLGEEDAERSWPESPIHEDTSQSMKEENPVTKTGFLDMEKGKEWNSPTRYPVNIIKTEKKRTKYWPHLLCCSSVYAAR